MNLVDLYFRSCNYDFIKCPISNLAHSALGLTINRRPSLIKWGLGLDVDIFPYLSIKAFVLGAHIYFLVGKKKAIFSYALLSGGPVFNPCHETVVFYMEYATREAQTQLRI